MTRKKLILSTGNKNKVVEIKDILKNLPIQVLSKDDIGFKDIDVVEDGETLEENAKKKAMAIGDKVDDMVIADDSGLFVDYLKGAPGIHSARYAGLDCRDEDNNLKLLKELEGQTIEDRGAYFETSIALIKPDEEIKTLIGRCSGKIGFEPRGDNGFGYDPIFIPDGYEETFAQLGDETKNSISHRALALEKLKKELIEILKDE